MRLYYHDLIGKRVVASDGQHLGRITDLIAQRRGEALRVTGLIVGETGLMRRIGFRRATLLHLVPPREIPWHLVARVEREVHLRVDSAAAAVWDGDGPRRTPDSGRRHGGGLA